MNELVFTKNAMLNEEPYTTCEIISKYAIIERESVTKLIRKYQSDFEMFGKVGFEIRAMDSGQKSKIYQLNEQQATLLITYLGNSKPVRKFKQELVNQFFAMKQELMKRQLYREIEKPLRKTLTDAIKGWEFSNNWSYKLITDLICKKITGHNTKQLKEARGVNKNASATDVYNSTEFIEYQKLESKAIALLEMNMTYEQIKAVINGESIEISLKINEKVGE